MALKYMNSIKIAIAMLSFVGTGLMGLNTEAPKSLPKKTINYGNAAKAAILTGTSAGGLGAYYVTAFKPFIIDKAVEKGLSHALWFNISFFLMGGAPVIVANAIPLFISGAAATGAYHYAKKIWIEEQETKKE